MLGGKPGPASRMDSFQAFSSDVVDEMPRTIKCGTGQRDCVSILAAVLDDLQRGMWEFVVGVDAR